MKSLILRLLIIVIYLSGGFVFGENIKNKDIRVLADVNKNKNLSKNERLIKRANLFINNNDIWNSIKEMKKVNVSSLRNSSGNEDGDYVELIQKFYEEGYTKEAVEFGILLFNAYPNEGARIIRLYFQDEAKVESAIDLLTEVGFDDIVLTLVRIDYLAVLGQYQDAEKLANELLELWINKDLVSFKNNFLTLVKLASKIRSSHYYSQLTNRILNELLEINNLNFHKRQIDQLSKLKEIKSNDKIVSITNMLSSRFYIDPNLSEIYGMSLESIQQTIENRLYDILKDNEIIFDVLHAFALDIKNDYPFFSINIIDDKTKFVGEEVNELIDACGEYNSLNENVLIRNNFYNEKEFNGSMIHEITHRLMDVLYDNVSIPYRIDDIEAQTAYQKTMYDLEEKLDILKREYDYFSKKKIITGNKLYDIAIESLLNVRELYDGESQLCEYIVRFPQSIANGTYGDVKVQELMQPLADYWKQYIEPNINLYLDKNGGNFIFISDTARENSRVFFAKKDLEAQIL